MFDTEGKVQIRSPSHISIRCPTPKVDFRDGAAIFLPSKSLGQGGWFEFGSSRSHNLVRSGHRHDKWVDAAPDSGHRAMAFCRFCSQPSRAVTETLLYAAPQPPRAL